MTRAIDADYLIEHIPCRSDDCSKCIFLKGIKCRLREFIYALPTLEQPTKCIATIQIDNEDLINRIKEDHEICRPHGEWQRFDDEYGYWIGCSNCKEYIPKDKFGNDMYTDYCPHCGASMGADMRGCD